MRLSVERLRWALIAGASLLVLLLAGWIGLGRYRAVRTWQRILQRSGASLTHETDGFTYSQSVQGKTVFTLHAAKAVQHSDGKWGLHDVVLTLYGRVPDRADRVYGSEFEYDEKEGVARALGEVQMDLQAPSALASKSRATPHGLEEAASQNAGARALGADTIHVRTSGLVYVRKLGVAATDQDVEFLYHGLQCQAKGAEFNSGQSILHLLAEVHLRGDAHGRPVDITAAKADLDRTTNVAGLKDPVVRSAGRTGSAANAVLYLRQDGSVERAQADGNVLLREGSKTLASNHLDASFDAQTAPQKARLSGGVTLNDTNPVRSEHATATQVDLSFDKKGALAGGVAASLNLLVLDRASGGEALRRQLAGDHVVAKLAPGKRKGEIQLSEIHASGSARASADSLTSDTRKGSGAGRSGGFRKTTTISADDLVASFAGAPSGGSALQRLAASGHTSLQRSASNGQVQSSTGETLRATFSAPSESPVRAGNDRGMGSVEIASAVQTGHVVIHSRARTKPGNATPPVPATASADRAEYLAAADRVNLSGNAQLQQGETSLSAGNVQLDTETGDAGAEGDVVVTLQGSSGPRGNNNISQSSSGPAAPATHVMADRAHLVHATRVSEFTGDAAHPARIWQGASQIEAASLVLDGARHTLNARPAHPGELVHAVFASAAPSAAPHHSRAVGSRAVGSSAAGSGAAGSGAAGEPASRAPQPAAGANARSGPGESFLRVSSATLDYSDLQREAVFAGAVQMEGTIGRARAHRAVVFLAPAAKPGHPAGERAPAATASVAAGSAAPAPFGGSVERVVLLGDVGVEQPGRRADGEQLTYTAASGSYVLTGTPAQPPRVVDAEQGSVSGATLLFGDAGSTIVVAGQKGNGKDGSERVHTEITVKHQ